MQREEDIGAVSQDLGDFARLQVSEASAGSSREENSTKEVINGESVLLYPEY
jgi:hypothetical protein